MATTFNIGPTEDPPTSTTWCCYAGSITGSSTNTGGPSKATPTEDSSSADPTDRNTRRHDPNSTRRCENSSEPRGHRPHHRRLLNRFVDPKHHDPRRRPGRISREADRKLSVRARYFLCRLFNERSAGERVDENLLSATLFEHHDESAEISACAVEVCSILPVKLSP